MVNQRGRRFVNEAAPYIDVVHTMYRLHRAEDPHIPAYFIFDETYRRRYLFGTLAPLQPLPRRYREEGYIQVAATLRELARKLGVDPDGLEATVLRFNAMARAGRDEDFHRGENAYDRYYSDPTVRPNPNLAPLERPDGRARSRAAGQRGAHSGTVRDRQHCGVGHGPHVSRAGRHPGPRAGVRLHCGRKGKSPLSPARREALVAPSPLSSPAKARRWS